jgi:hypothetical protein
MNNDNDNLKNYMLMQEGIQFHYPVSPYVVIRALLPEPDFTNRNTNLYHKHQALIQKYYSGVIRKNKWKQAAVLFVYGSLYLSLWLLLVWLITVYRVRGMEFVIVGLLIIGYLYGSILQMIHLDGQWPTFQTHLELYENYKNRKR